MKITKIKKVRNNLYELTIAHGEDVEIFKLSEDYLIQYQLYNNKEISEKDYLEIQALANKSKIYQKTLNYLSYKMRAESEIRKYLHDNNCVEPLTTEIINKLKKLNYINDKTYCELYIKQQFDVSKNGPLLIKNNLLNKEIDEGIIETCLEYINDEKINHNINYLISYYDKLNKKKSVKQLKEAILRNLLKKGYNYDEILNNLNIYSFTDNNDDGTLLKQEMLKAYKKYQKKYESYELKMRIIKTLLGKGFIYEDILNMYSSLNMEV